MRATVIDAHHHLTPRGQAAHAHQRAKRQCAVRGGQGVHVKALAAGGAFAVQLRAVPRGQAVLLARRRDFRHQGLVGRGVRALSIGIGIDTSPYGQRPCQRWTQPQLGRFCRGRLGAISIGGIGSGGHIGRCARRSAIGHGQRRGQRQCGCQHRTTHAQPPAARHYRERHVQHLCQKNRGGHGSAQPAATCLPGPQAKKIPHMAGAWAPKRQGAAPGPEARRSRGRQPQKRQPRPTPTSMGSTLKRPILAPAADTSVRI